MIADLPGGKKEMIFRRGDKHCNVYKTRRLLAKIIYFNE